MKYILVVVAAIALATLAMPAAKSQPNSLTLNQIKTEKTVKHQPTGTKQMCNWFCEQVIPDLDLSKIAIDKIK